MEGDRVGKGDFRGITKGNGFFWLIFLGSLRRGGELGAARWLLRRIVGWGRVCRGELWVGAVVVEDSWGRFGVVVG